MGKRLKAKETAEKLGNWTSFVGFNWGGAGFCLHFYGNRVKLWGERPGYESPGKDKWL